MNCTVKKVSIQKLKSKLNKLDKFDSSEVLAVDTQFVIMSNFKKALITYLDYGIVNWNFICDKTKILKSILHQEYYVSVHEDAIECLGMIAKVKEQFDNILPQEHDWDYFAKQDYNMLRYCKDNRNLENNCLYLAYTMLQKLAKYEEGSEASIEDMLKKYRFYDEKVIANLNYCGSVMCQPTHFYAPFSREEALHIIEESIRIYEVISNKDFSMCSF